jgi:predicted transcriptional regulator
LAAKHYRSKLELLRDFLAAARTESIKTRIMNRANLNQVSFSRYVTFCQDRELLVEVSGGYALTPHAENLLQSINQVLSKALELRVAVDVLNHTARSGGYRLIRSEISLRSFDQLNPPDLFSQLPALDRRSAPLRQE